MLQSFRERFQGRFVWIIFTIIILSFGIAGIGSLKQCSTPAARVEGAPIHWQEIFDLYKDYSKLNPELIKSTNKSSILVNMRDYLVRERSFDMQLNRLGFKVNNQYLEETIRKDSNFQENGQFSAKKYALRLEEAGTTATAYEQSLRKQLLREQLKNIIINSSFILPKEKNIYKDLWFQERNISYVVIEPSLFHSKIVISPSEISDHYNANAHQFISKKKVKISYLPITLDAVAKDINISHDDALQYYNEHKNDFIIPDRVQVRHILISNDTKSNDTALTKINDIYKQLKSGSNFSILAKKHSDDPGSAANGGELGWIERGMTVREFENSAFALQNKNDLSPITKTDFGYHIIQLQNKESKKAQDFSKVKTDIIQILTTEKARQKFADLRQHIIDLQSKESNINDIAKDIALKVSFSDFLTEDASDTPLILRNKKVMQALFHQDNAKIDHLIDIDDASCVLIHVIETQNVRPLTQKEASLNIHNILVANKAESEADRLSKTIVNLVNEDKDFSSILAEYKLNLKQEKINYFTNSKLEPEILTTAFTIPRSKKMHAKYLKLANENYIIVILNSISTLATQTDDMTKQLFILPAKRDLALMEYLLINNSKVIVYDLPKELT